MTEDNLMTWADCGKRLVFELQHGRARPGKVYRRRGQEEALCPACVKRTMPSDYRLVVAQEWLWVYQRKVDCNCTWCGARVPMNTSFQAAREREIERQRSAERARGRAMEDGPRHRSSFSILTERSQRRVEYIIPDIKKADLRRNPDILDTE